MKRWTWILLMSHLARVAGAEEPAAVVPAPPEVPLLAAYAPPKNLDKPTPAKPNAPAPGQAMPLESLPLPTGDVDETGMSLQEFVFLAQTSHPALREASARVGMAQGNAIQVGLPPNPFVFTSTPQLAGSSSQYNVVLGQDFVTAGKLRLSRAAAQRQVLESQIQFTRTRFDVITAVRTRFYAAAIVQRRTEVLRQLVEVTMQSRDVGKKLLEAGETNRADAMLLEIEFDKAAVGLANNEAVLDAARRQLAASTGSPEIAVGRLKFDLSTPLPEYEHEALRLGVVDRNALAQAAAVEIQRTQIALRRAQVEPWPNFQLQAGYQYSVEGPRYDQGYGQFTMSVPLYDRNQGGIRSARAETARAVAGLQRTEAELSQEAAAALGQYAAASAQVEIYEKQILPKSREVFQVNRNLFQQGQTDFLRLLQSQRTLIESDLGYLEAQQMRWTAAATIAGLLQLEQFP